MSILENVHHFSDITDFLFKTKIWFPTFMFLKFILLHNLILLHNFVGAFGYFEVTHDITKYSKAAVFSEIGKKTPIAIRFSTVGGESGSADTVRDPRGFAVKFYTEEGNWDLVGNNTPIFFIRDPILFPSFIHTQKRNPATHLKVIFFSIFGGK